ncbi:MAG: DUF2809 domain-containing protein [Saprospiraceae bacterium]
MFTFRKKYLFLTIILFIIEVLIALYVRDSFIRPYFGDFLVVILIYCFLRTFLSISPLYIAIFTLLFAFAIEIGQYFKLVEILGLKGNKLAETVIGTGYSNHDMVMYTLGVLFVYFIDNYQNRHNES